MVNPEQHIKEAVCQVCSGEFAQLRSIVLTGSMARQESSFSNRNGSWHCEGDAECLLVFDSRSKLPDSAWIASAIRQIDDRLGVAGICCPVYLSPVTMNYFRKMQPHIFGYELRMCGDVIWGDPAVLRAIPEFGAGDIPKEDAWRMLANRLIELLECAASDLRSDAPLTPALQYKLAKLYLDMASSYLIFVNAFEAGYRRRAEILEQVAAAQPNHPFQSLETFVERVRSATRYKLQGEGTVDERASCIFAAITDAKALWLWELKELSQSPSGMPKQSAYQRLRGWSFVARRCGWGETLRYGTRWLTGGLRSSPRYSIYRAATEILFGLGTPITESKTALVSDELSRLLPVVRHNQSANWREMAVEIGWNYHQFLEATRA